MTPLMRLLYLLIAIAVFGCNDSSTRSASDLDKPPASVSFSIHWQTPPQEDPDVKSRIDRFAPLDDCPVEKVQCKIYGDDGEALTVHTWPCADHSGTIDDIPPGPNRQIIIFGLDGNDRIVYRGQANRSYDFSAGEKINIGRIEAATFVPDMLEPADGASANFADLTLTWDGVGGAEEYHVTVSQNRDFSAPVIEYYAPGVSCMPSELSIAKTYYWRVSAVDAYQNRGVASVFRSFNVAGHRLPDTGQTDSSFEDTFGEDADYNIYPPSYRKLDASGGELEDIAEVWAMVRDEVTGLIWEVKTDDNGIRNKDNTYAWDNLPDQFIAVLNEENYGGHSDWRMPTIRELTSLINYGSFGPAINTIYFPNTQPANYWSISELEGEAENANAWAVNFQTGYASASGDNRKKSISFNVRAVRGEPGGYDLNNILRINGDTGTVTDNRTGLMWQHVADAQARTWVDALEYCENLELAGHKDWRLPNLRELHSIVDFNRRYPAIEQNYFPGTDTAVYWSSTRYAHRDATPYDFLVWGIYFQAGATSAEDIQFGGLVRAVRGGQ